MEEQQTKKWYKNKYLWIFTIIILAALGIRLYYFLLTANQPQWWDSSEYLSTAKAYAGIMSYDLSGQRLPGYPFFISLFYSMGVTNELILGFLVNFIPGILVVILTYLLISKMYKDKRVALISTALMAVLWEDLFYSNRFMTDNFGLLFELLAILGIYLFIEKKKWWLLPLAGLSLVIDVAFRPGNLMIIPAIGLFIIIACWKENKIISLMSIVFGMILAAIFYLVPSLQYIITSNMNTNNIGPAWNSLSVFNGLLLSPFLYVPFFIGLLVGIFEFFKKEDSTKDGRNSNILNFLLIISVLSIYIFIIRAPNFEFRWFFGMLLAILCFTAKGIIDIADGIASVFGDISKFISIVLITIILGAGLFAQLSYADPIIKEKAGSYEGIKDVGLWIKNHSEINDVIFSISKPQTAYYSERKVMSYSLLNTTEQMNDYVARYKPKYVEVSLYEPHPNWTQEWITADQDALTPVFGAKLDKDNKLGALIYEIDYSKLNISNCKAETETSSCLIN